MKINVNHPSFIAFLESITNNILSGININDYFTLTKEKQLSVSFTVFNLLRNSAKIKANLSNDELKGFIAVLCKKNEEIENYEFAAVLNDIIKNYDAINDLTNSTKKSSKSRVKIDSNLEKPPQNQQ
jgi:hypothetical protein